MHNENNNSPRAAGEAAQAYWQRLMKMTREEIAAEYTKRIGRDPFDGSPITIARAGEIAMSHLGLGEMLEALFAHAEKNPHEATQADRPEPAAWKNIETGGGATALHREVFSEGASGAEETVMEWLLTEQGAPTAPTADEPCTLTLCWRGEELAHWNCNTVTEAKRIAEGMKVQN